jgi:pSer/pThr/pTyr-binding forkhead associated (FHA) protein
VSFGRRPDNDVALDWDGQVSRVHAELALGPDGWTLADKQSRNGSFVNGEPVDRPHLLRDGDVVRLGDTILLYREPTSPEQVALADAHSGITVLGRQLMSP